MNEEGEVKDSSDEELLVTPEAEDTSNESEDEGGDPSEVSGPEKAWPTGMRAPLNFEGLHGGFQPTSWTRVLLAMDGKRGRDDAEALGVAKGLGISNLKGRPRNHHAALEQCGVIRPTGTSGLTKLSRLGRMLRSLSGENGLHRYVASEALDFLCRYQSDNPVDGQRWPHSCRVHPYWMTLHAACKLDYRIHWDEVNRELMHALDDNEADGIISRIAAARQEPGYEEFIGGHNDAQGPLRPRAHLALETAPPGKTPEGQLKDQRLTPFLKQAGFGELLLSSPGKGGNGWWTVPEEVRDILDEAVRNVPPHVVIENEDEWIEWLYEGRRTVVHDLTGASSPPPASEAPAVVTPVRDLTVGKLKDSLKKFYPELNFSDSLLASVVAAVRSGDGRNFIILRGVSGTGKSKLVAALAAALYGVKAPPRPYLTQIEVRPDWIDVLPLLGHRNPITQEWETPRFMQALLKAQDEFEREESDAAPIIVCLDEMNLAPVEQYLADCLSAMESGSELDHGHHEDGLPRSLRWSPNLFLFGTVNVDESTQEISDKVLDRAQVIDTSDIDITDALDEWLSGSSHLDATERSLIKETILDCWKPLRKIQKHFGFRTARSMVRFVDEAKASSDGTMDVSAALDAQIAQKILVKLRGEGEHWQQPLSDLRKVAEKVAPAGRSVSILKRMIEDHGRMGSFQFWT